MSSRLQRQAPTEALLHRDHLNIRFPYQNEICPYQNENFPTNHHHKKQTHKQTDDVITLQVKQTNTAKIFKQNIHKQMIKQTIKQFN